MTTDQDGPAPEHVVFCDGGCGQGVDARAWPELVRDGRYDCGRGFCLSVSLLTRRAAEYKAAAAAGGRDENQLRRRVAELEGATRVLRALSGLERTLIIGLDMETRLEPRP